MRNSVPPSRSVRRAGFLALAAALLSLLSGCCGVYTPYPLKRDIKDAKTENLPVGVWFSGAPLNLEARVGPDGHALIGAVDWDKEAKRYRLITTEAWLTPRAGDLGVNRGFVSVHQNAENGEPIDRWGLLEYGRKGTTLRIWFPRPGEFERAIEEGELEGNVYSGGHGDDPVVVTSPKEKLLAFLESSENTGSGRYDPGPGGTLFKYIEPIELHQDGTKLDDATGAFALAWGGNDTLKDPLPFTQVAKATVKAAGLFAVGHDTPKPAAGPAGVVLVIATKPTLQSATTRIPAVLGANFGVNFVVDGSPTGKTAHLTLVWRFPQPGLGEPKQALPTYCAQSSVYCTLGEETFLGYTLLHDWELVPGTWTMELWKGNRRLLVQHFELVAPAATD